MHLLSPLSKNLFKRAIMQSGSALVPWAVFSQDEAILNTFELAKNVGCPYNYSKISQTIDCLREKDAEYLVKKESDVKHNIVEFPFVPVVDGHFFVDEPKILLEKGEFKNTDILMGSNKEEAFFFLLTQPKSDFPRRENFTIPQEILEKTVKNIFPQWNHAMIKALISKYIGNNLSDGLRNLNALDKMVGDVKFTCGVNNYARMYAENDCNVYMYYFTQQSEKDPWPKWTGVKHADEVNYIFGGPLDESLNFPQIEQHFSRRMMRYWANFAKTG